VKKIRKVNKAQRKQKRQDAQERLEKQSAMLLDHPKECCLCTTAFERTHETVKTWQVTVKESRVRLTCPSCAETLTQALEKLSGKY
tara:strand:+ start:2638 stop:2895 length:258 start_codon:yes stop_codon:yes gene_type:complete